MSKNFLDLLIKNKNFIIKLIVAIDCLVIGLVVLSAWWPKTWYELASKSGSVSVLFLILALLPGMMSRFGFAGWLLKVRVFLMSLRRYFGINMYLFGLFHFLWLRLMPILISHRSTLLVRNVFELFGVLTLFIGLPLFITSNDWSVKKLGKLWKKLQNFVFVMILLLIGHLILLSELEPITLLLIATAIAELISWIYWGVSKKSRIFKHGLILN